MTDRPAGRRDNSDDVRAIPTGRRMGSPPESGPPDANRPITTGAPASAASARVDPVTRVMPQAPPAGPRTPTPPPGPRVPGGVGPPPVPRPRHRLRRGVAVVALLAVAWIGATAWAISSVWGTVSRVDATPAPGHIGDTEGRNYLLVGSDARADLTPAQRRELGTGFTEGARTDSIMLLHTGSGKPTLLSIPRDSFVEIPGVGPNKINAAFAFGGPPLLAETIESATGLRVDGYLEIGFGGFASLVDAVDGVRMCLPGAIKDDKAHIDLPSGCQTLDGKNALGYVRARYFDPEGDLGRVTRQRQFLGALMGKIASPVNVLLPWRLHSLGTAGAAAITIGTDDGMVETGRAFLALRTVSSGDGHSVTVPISNAALPTSAGTAVEWDPVKAPALFAQLRDDQPLSVTP